MEPLFQDWEKVKCRAVKLVHRIPGIDSGMSYKAGSTFTMQYGYAKRAAARDELDIIGEADPEPLTDKQRLELAEKNIEKLETKLVRLENAIYAIKVVAGIERGNNAHNR